MRESVANQGTESSGANWISYTHPSASYQCANWLDQMLHTDPFPQELACLCIGTDRSTGDSLGPLVGTQLEKRGIPFLRVYGTLEEPVHAVNLNQTLSQIKSDLKNPCVIAIDACLGQLANVGKIQVGNGPLKPGAGVNKQLPEVGQVHITGIVNVSGFMEYFVLQNTRLSVVMKMADVIASAIETVSIHKLRHLSHEKKES
ncbi:spore protease YyaC [Melghirimyces algeriensis]|uniref:Putative sporulation protein YyaC n=1 Tax=Melghirimyces algeriensis TaxID=910412 RepID=A0A521DCM7_9BACL|nr:spore protease YyaC [Melghirimyces algeriensis]SMO68680.1 putative sporulation protein YyaC [Melghirimyces algeriensis]